MPPVLKQSNAGNYVSRFTHDKQKMWEQAMQSVMANYKLDQATYKELMDAYQTAIKELSSDIQDSRNKIAKLKEKQITADAATDRWNAGQKNATQRANNAIKNAAERAKASASRAQRKSAEDETYEDLVSSTGKAIVTQTQFGQDPTDISNKLNVLDNRIQGSTEISDKTGKEANVMYAQAVKEAVRTEANKGEYAALPTLEAKEASAKAKVLSRLTPIQRQRAESGLSAIELETTVEGADVDVFYSGRTEAGGPDYGALIRAEEERLKMLEQQGVTAPEKPTIDLIKQTRDEYHSKFSQPDYVPAYQFNEGLQTLQNIGQLPEAQRIEALTVLRDAMARSKGLTAPSGAMTESDTVDLMSSEGYQREAARRATPEVQAELAAGLEARRLAMENDFAALPEPTDLGGPESTAPVPEGSHLMPDGSVMKDEDHQDEPVTPATELTSTQIHQGNQLKVGERAALLLKDGGERRKAFASQVGMIAQDLYASAKASGKAIDINNLTAAIVKAHGDDVATGIEGSAILMALAAEKAEETMMTEQVDEAPVAEEKPEQGNWIKDGAGSVKFEPTAE